MGPAAKGGIVPSIPGRAFRARMRNTFTGLISHNGLSRTEPPLEHGAPRPLEVLMLTEGSYPFHWGGVSTWAHTVVSELPDVAFKVLAIVASPRLEPAFQLPPNVVDVRAVPMWGVREVSETRRDLKFGALLRRRRSTTESNVLRHFVPPFGDFLRLLLTPERGGGDSDRLARSIHRMYSFLIAHDFDATFRSRAVWDCFGQTVDEEFPKLAAAHDYSGTGCSMSDLRTGLQWIYHWFFPLATPVPRADVAHAALAGVCTMIAIICKLEHGAAYLLTEHGIYLRERYLAESRASSGLFLKLLGLGFARRMTELSYSKADQISPCCDYNQRWELQNGATPRQLRTIYYGVDLAAFTPLGKPIGEAPLVVWVGRVNLLKDLLTLLHAAALARKTRPDIRFELYGSPQPGDEEYYEECLALRSELSLEDAVTFCGYVSDPQAAFNRSDVVVLSSISEGFPYCTLEAMACGKPVVATAVGGVPEQIEGCGITVEPRNPTAMSEAILGLINDPARCAAMGQAARKKAQREFTARLSAGSYYSSYLRLSERGRKAAAAPVKPHRPAPKRPVAAAVRVRPLRPAWLTRGSPLGQTSTSMRVDEDWAERVGRLLLVALPT